MAARRKRLLFVDDEKGFLNALARMLRPQRDAWQMTFVGSVDEALAELEASQVDVVVTDVQMPAKDGFALLKTLRMGESTKDIPVLVMTGEGEPGQKTLALDLGASDVVAKPLCLEELLSRLRSVLRLKSYHDELQRTNARLEDLVAERTTELEYSRLSIIWRLAKAAEYRDAGAGNHVSRVGCYSAGLAEELKGTRDFVERVFLTSPLHDIGKMGVPEEILHRPGGLLPREMEVMQSHCEIGAWILTEAPEGMRALLEWRGLPQEALRTALDNDLLRMAARIALTHHEAWNGSGYPRGLCGSRIPLEARITALADMYDALSSERAYKHRYPEERVLRLMREASGRRLDPSIHRAFLRRLDEFRSIQTRFADTPDGAL